MNNNDSKLALDQQPRTLPGETKAAVALPSWASPQEKWAWDQISSGKVADLSKLPTYLRGAWSASNGISSPIKRNGDPSNEPMRNQNGEAIEIADSAWPKWQVLSSRFLSLILLHPLWRDSQAKRGVQIKCAKITNELDLSGQSVNGDLWLDYCLILKNLDFRQLELTGSLSLEGTKLCGALRADRISVSEGIFLGKTCVFKKEVKLLGATIGQNLNCSGSVFQGAIKADRVRVGGSVFLCDGAIFNSDVNFPFTKINQNVHLWEGTFNKILCFTGSEIGGNFRLEETSRGCEPPTWCTESEILLQNVKVEALQGTLKAWLIKDSEQYAQRDLSEMHFRYVKGGAGGQSLESESSKALSAWLHDGTMGLSPSPYFVLANALQLSGHHRKARHIRYAEGERQRHLEKKISRKVVLWLSSNVIGHGYKLNRSGWWLAGLAIIPALFGQLAQHDFTLVFPNAQSFGEFLAWLRFSIENAVPIILSGSDTPQFLSNRFENNGLELARWGALLQRLSTTIVLGFVLSGLAGWARRRGE